MAEVYDIKQKVDEWLSLDKNEETRSEIEDLFKTGNESELRARLCDRMTFGTAGLRARMGAGYDRMNDLTILQTTQGLACYLEQQFGIEVCHTRGVVVGYDARHNSYRFGKLVATVFINRGFKVYLFTRVTPTPFTPYAVRLYNCVAGVMVTASHNPKQDNGYKVYWSNGAQIIRPHDKGISSCIESNLIPLPSSWDTEALNNHPKISDPYQEVQEGYYSSIMKYCYRRKENLKSSFRCVYTAMHGVGYPYAKLAFKAFGLPDLIPVSEQIEPDPEFPTVKYPNPEEGESALNLAISTANRNNCCVIIANDPDADRLALAEKVPSNNGEDTGGWRVFNGNETGALLAWWALENFKKKNPSFDGSKVHMICSTVSSKLLRSMAAIEGIQFEETLTGFKWMGNRSHSLLQSGHEVLFAFEEAIGFMYGTTVLDKDGVSAGVVAGEMAAWLYENNRSFSSLLEDIYTMYGRFVSNNSYFICDSKQTISDLFESLRKDRKYPETCGSARVVAVCDLTVGYDSTRPPDYKPVLPVDPSCQLITFKLDNSCEFTLRTSGTEPKIKYYTEMSTQPGENISEESLRQILNETVHSIIAEFLKPDVYGLLPRSPRSS